VQVLKHAVERNSLSGRIGFNMGEGIKVSVRVRFAINNLEYRLISGVNNTADP
jgi:hypothetical protein